MALVLGIDSSTQSVKVEVREAYSGAVRGIGRAIHPPTTPPRSEQDPEAWWLALAAAVGHALAQARETGPEVDVAAISVAGQQHAMVVLDSSGQVLRPAKLWNDTESAPESAGLIDALRPPGWANACGSVPVPSFTITKLAWLATHEPDSFARLATVLLPHDWLTYRLSGQIVTDRGDASGTGYWSPREERWRIDLLEMVDATVDWAARLPRVAGPFASVGPMMDDVAIALGLGDPVVAGRVLVGPGTGDNMAAALGIGLRPGDVAISLGTSGTVFSVSDQPTADGSGAVAGFADASGRFLPLVCTLNATKVTEAVRGLLGVDHDELDALALSAPSGAGGLVLLPYFDGERTPNRPAATGVLSGIRSDVSRPQLARAAFEGVVCGLLDGLDALNAAGVPTSGRLLLIGGGAKSMAYREVVAALTQREVIVPLADEHVATGACVQAACVLSSARGESVDPIEVACRWGLGEGQAVTPDRSVDAVGVRAAYAALRG